MGDAQSLARLSASMDTVAGVGDTVAAFTTSRNRRRALEYNAAVGEALAQDAERRGALEETRLRRQGERVRGRQAAAFGAGNVQLQGSALDILEETDRAVEEDAAVIRGNAAREAFGRRAESRLSRFQARAESPALATVGSLLTSSTRVADRWYRYRDEFG